MRFYKQFSFSFRFSRFLRKILFLFSIYEILKQDSLSLLEFSRFLEKNLFLFSFNDIFKTIPFLFSRIPKNFQVDQGYQGHHGHQGHQGLMMIGWLTNATSVDTPRLGRANLRAHLNIHSGEKSNKCNQCDYASSQASSLGVHLNAHIGEKSSKCNQCYYAFSYASNLRTHFKNTYCRKVKQMQSM